MFLGNITTQEASRLLDIFKLADGSKIFRAHRDDQSAFVFLIDKLFGRNGKSLRQVMLYHYAKAYWRSSITADEALAYIKENNELKTCK